jgi:hypothetical protein
VILSLIEDNETIDDYMRNSDDLHIDMGSPGYGFEGFDEDAAIDAFHEEYDVEKRFRDALGEDGVLKFEQEKSDHKLYMDERTRLADQIRSKFKDVSPAVRQELQEADQAFRNGDHAPFVKAVKAVIPDAFPFAPPVEEPVSA